MASNFTQSDGELALVPGGSNWVYGDRFFDREAETEALRERVGNGTHTLLTAQRRMGKTSLVRELLRRLDDEGQFATVFVDLEAAMDGADAVAEMAIQAQSVQSIWRRIQTWSANRLGDIRDNVEEVGVSELKVRVRAGMDAGNWQRDGDRFFEALAANERPVVLAIDELSILVNRLLKGHDYRITPERRAATDRFMSWLRRNCQAHPGRVCLIISGSVGLGPILRQAGLSAQANVFAPFDLQPWSRETSMDCLAALARGQGINLSEEVRGEMCRRLRCCVPHHVQQFFHHLHERLVRDQRSEATMADVEQVYEHELLSVRGQIDLVHYEDRLRTLLGNQSYTVALGLLTEAAVNGGLLTHETVRRYLEMSPSSPDDEGVPVEHVLYSLEHDGYLESQDGGYGFVSGLLEDWWRARHGQYFTPINQR
jgi:hypothetical protein